MRWNSTQNKMKFASMTGHVLGVSITGEMVCDFWTFCEEIFRKVWVLVFLGEDTEIRVESFRIYLSLKVHKRDFVSRQGGGEKKHDRVMLMKSWGTCFYFWYPGRSNERKKMPRVKPESSRNPDFYSVHFLKLFFIFPRTKLTKVSAYTSSQMFSLPQKNYVCFSVFPHTKIH